MPSLSFLKKSPASYLLNRDLIDANTASDREKRKKKGEKELYADQKRAEGHTRPANNIGQQFLGAPARLVNTAKTLNFDTAPRAGAGLYFMALHKAGKMTDKEYVNAVNNTLSDEKVYGGYKATGGVFDAGTVIDSPDQAKNLKTKDVVKKSVAEGMALYGDVGSAGAGRSALKIGGKALSPLLTRTLEGAASGVIGDAGYQLVDTGRIDPRQTLGSALFGGTLSNAGPVASKLLGRNTPTPRTPDPRLNDADVSGLLKIKNGRGDFMDDVEYTKALESVRKAGIDITKPEAWSQIDGVLARYNQVLEGRGDPSMFNMGQSRFKPTPLNQGGYIKNPLASNTPDVPYKSFKRKDGKTNITIDGKMQTVDEFTDTLGNKKTRLKNTQGDTYSVDGWISDNSWNIKDGSTGEIKWLEKQISEEKNPGKRQELARKRYELQKSADTNITKNPLAKDPLESLKQEARKYKSAEEFVDSKINSYHQTDAKFDKFENTNQPFRFSGANFFLDTKPPKTVKKYLVEANTNLKNPLVIEDGNITQPMVDKAIKDGYDGIINKLPEGNGFPKRNEIAVFNPETIQTRQQLTNLYNQATQSQPPKSPLANDAPQGKTRTYKTSVGDSISDLPTEVISTDGGYIRILKDSPYAPDNRTSIVKVMTDEGSRRQGVGSDLVQQAIDKHGNISAFAENEASQRMFYKKGLRPLDEPNASLERTLAIGKEQGGGVTMVNDIKSAPQVGKTDITTKLDIHDAPKNVIKPGMENIPEPINVLDDPVVADYAKYLKDNGNAKAGDSESIITRVKDAGGISSSAYEDVPLAVKNSTGPSADYMARELGYDSEDALMEAINGAKPKGKMTKAQYREEALSQLQSGNADPAFQSHYNDMQDPETRSLLETPEANKQPTPKGFFFNQPTTAVDGRSPDLTPGTGERKMLTPDEIQGNNVSPEAQAILKDSPYKTYQKSSNEELVNTARAKVEADPVGAAGDFWDAVNGGTFKKDTVATGAQLIAKAARDGNPAEEARLYEAMAYSSTETAQALQSLSTIDKMSPEGLLLFTQREINRHNESRGILDKVRGKGGELSLSPEAVKSIRSKAEVREALPGGRVGDEADRVAVELGDTKIKSPNDVEKVIDDIIDQADGEEAPATVGEQVAKKVDKAAQPAKKKKAVDNLVEEITKKVKQEMLPPKPGAPKKSPSALLKEVLERNPEARDAFPEAQNILFDKYADDPEMMDVLQKFFDAEPKLPIASTTIDKAVAEQLRLKKVDISKVIYESISKQKATEQDIARALRSNDMDIETAQLIAKEVVDRVATKTASAKKKALEKMLETAPERAKPTLIDKINKLSNVGALDSMDHIEIARARLGLDKLDPKVAKRISELSQELQDNPARAQELTDEIMQEIADQVPPSWSEKFDAYRYQNALSNPRAHYRNVVSNLFNTMITRPVTLATNATEDFFGAALRGTERTAYFSDVPAYYRGLLSSTAQATEAMKGAWSGKIPTGNPDLKQLRAFRNNNMPKKLTGITRLMEAQDRFFSTLISAGEYAKNIKNGIPEADAKSLADKVAEYSLFRQALDPKNETGQGAMLSAIDSFTETITKAAAKHRSISWFVPFIRTPMNIAKQQLEYSPLGLATLKGATNKKQQLSKAMIGTTVALMGAKMALDGQTTWDVPKDAKEREAFYAEGKRPFSVNIKGNWVPMTYFGPLAFALGLGAAVKDANDDQPMDASAMDRMTASLVNVTKQFSGQTYVQGLANFVDVMTGNNDANLQTSIAFTASQAIPFSGLQRFVAGVIDPTFRKKQSFVDSFKADTPGFSKDLDPYLNPDGTEARRNITDYTAPYTIGLPSGGPAEKLKAQGTTQFYSKLRQVTPLRDDYNTKINEAIAKNDLEEAQKLSKEYNDKLRKNLQSWHKKYGTTIGEAEKDSYSRAKIKLTSTSIRQRRYTILKKAKQGV